VRIAKTNKKIKKASKTKLSNKELKKELLKCSRDPIYFFKKYIKIVHITRGLISFNVYNYQEKLVTDFKEQRHTIILKARQLGISTVVAAYTLWFILFQKEKSVAILATKLVVAQELMLKIKKAYENLPDFMKISKVTTDTKTEIRFDNGSWARSLPSSPDAGRSLAASLLIIDEAAHIENMEEIWTSIGPTITTGGRVIMLSTPNGLGNVFHKIYSNAEAEVNMFHHVKLMWSVHPERDQKWYDLEKANSTDLRKFSQEYECSFLASGHTVIDPLKIQELVEITSEPLFKHQLNYHMHIWETYKPKHEYMISVDVSRGDAEDYSAFHVFDLFNMNQVGEFKDKVDISLLSDLVYDISLEYGEALIVVENNNLGYMLLDKLVNDKKATNIYYSSKNTHEFVEFHEAQVRNDVVPGFSTTTRTRIFAINKFHELVMNGNLKINSKRFVEEIQRFIWKNGKPQAMKGYNDDLVMAAAIGCWVKEMIMERNMYHSEMASELLNNIVVVKKSNQVMHNKIKGYNSRNFNIIFGNARDTKRSSHHNKVKDSNGAWIFPLMH